MKELRLILKKQFAKEILEGKKHREYRDYSGFYIQRLLDFGTENEQTVYCDNGVHFTPIHYDAIRFWWYSKEYLLVECKAWTVLTKGQCKDIKTPDGVSFYEMIRDEYDLEDAPDDYTFFLFELGKIIEDKSNIKI